MKSYLLYFIIFLSNTYAHPHVFIEVFPTIISKDDKINNIFIQWRYDQMTSQLMIMESDVNMNGKIDKEEIPYIKKNFFDVTKNFNYYTYINIDGKKIKTDPKNFNVKLINGLYMALEYNLDINKPKNKVDIEFYDEEMYNAFMLKKDFISSNTNFNIVNINHDFYHSYKIKFY